MGTKSVTVDALNQQTNSLLIRTRIQAKETGIRISYSMDIPPPPQETLKEVDGFIDQVVEERRDYIRQSYWATIVAGFIFDFLVIYFLFRMMGAVTGALVAAAALSTGWANIARKHLVSYLALVKLYQMHQKNAEESETNPPMESSAS